MSFFEFPEGTKLSHPILYPEMVSHLTTRAHMRACILTSVCTLLLTAVPVVRACGDPACAVYGTQTCSHTLWAECHSCGQPQRGCVNVVDAHNSCGLCCVSACVLAVMPVHCAAGLRFLPLRDSCGHLIHQSGFFVLICKTTLNPDRRGGLGLQTSIVSENGPLDNGQELVQNGGHVQNSGQMDLDNTSQAAKRKRISRQRTIEEHSTSSECVVVELH